MPPTSTRVVLAMVAAVCVTLITNALDTSPTVSFVGAALAAAVPALINAGGRHGVAIGLGVTAAALGATYLGFTAADAATDRALTFPAPSRAQEWIEDGGQPDGTTTGQAEQVAVPDVEGKSYSEAVEVLSDAGLNADAVGVESSQQPATVLDQDPAAGATVGEAETVTLAISPVELPDVTGATENEAREQLEAFDVSVVTAEVSDENLDGVVLAQGTSAGVAAADTPVRLTIGKLAPVASNPEEP